MRVISAQRHGQSDLRYPYRMPEADREILTFRYALDYDASEIAEVLAIQITAVHMRLSRARQRLAERLTAKGVHEAP